MKNNYSTGFTFFILIMFCPFHSVFGQHYIEITDGPQVGTKMEIRVGGYKNYCDLPLGVEQIARFCNPYFGGNVNNINELTNLGLSTDEVGVCSRGGSFSYDIKAKNIDFSGGSAMIVVNNDSLNPDILPFVGGSQTPDPDFWGIALSFSNGKLLKSSGETTFKFIILTVEDNSNDEVIWEDGQFAGGIGVWSTEGIACGLPSQDPSLAVWKYDPKGEAKSPWNSSSTIASVTACNGAMVFNSELYHSEGGQTGDGPCLKKQIGELISPLIDLSSLNNGDPVTLKFYQNVYHANSSYFVAWSNDGGISWQQKEINDDLMLGTLLQNQVRVRLDGASPSPNFQVKFIYHGDDFFWTIDDVKLVRSETFLSVIDADWVSSAPYPTVPLSLVEPIQFMTNVENVSDQDLTGTTLTVTVSNDFGEEVYSAAADVTSAGHTPGNLLKGDKIENIILGNYLPKEVGNYKVKYEVSSLENDWGDELNSVFKTFTVSRAVFGDWGREDGITGNISMDFDSTERVDWAYSNLFRIDNNTVGVSPHVSFHVVNAGEMGQIGATAQFYIYECMDINNDNIYTKDEYEVVGYNYYDFSPGDPDNLSITMPILKLNSTEEIIPGINPNKVFILSLVYQAPLTSPNTKLYWGMSDKTNQKAMEYLSTQNDTYMATHEAHSPWTIDGAIDCSPQRPVFEGTPVPYARFNYMALSINTAPLDPDCFNVWPSNTKDYISVQLNYKQNSATNIEVYNLKGNRIYFKKFETRQIDIQTINVENYVQGTYFVKVTTPEGTLSKSFNVIR